MGFLTLCSVLACLAVSCSLQAVRGDVGYSYSTSLRMAQQKWMASLPDSARIFVDLTIPGTHNSGSYTYEALVGHQCQRVNVVTQLGAGVRFLDIRLAFIYGDLYVVHGWWPTKEFAEKFETILSQIQKFLAQHPSEVIIMRLKPETVTNVEGPRYMWHKDLFVALMHRFDNIRDYACTDSRCAMGPSRGKVIFLTDGIASPPNRVGFLPYHWILQWQQDAYSVFTIWDLYSKWTLARSHLIRTSTSQRSVGSINFFSASGGATPYFVASGQAIAATGGPSLWTGLSKACWDSSWNVYPDFPRKSCAFFGRGTICSIYFRGTNNMLYDWLVKGRRGEAQSREVSYVWPRHLGILALDFPDNALLDEIIAVNFASPRNPFKGQEKIPAKCIELPTPSCIAGDVQMLTESRGVIAARDVKVGDYIRGMGDGEWCKVIDTRVMNENGTAFGNFTSDHLVVEDATELKESYIVKPHGNATGGRHVDLVNIFTTCPVTVALHGERFTPFSTVFCKNLTWKQYLPLYTGIINIVMKTGNFWFDPSIYKTQVMNSTTDMELINKTSLGKFGNWEEDLPGVCEAMMSCISKEDGCPDFEVVAARWIHSYLPTAQKNSVLGAFPNLGDPDARDGNLSEAVRSSRGWLIPVVVVAVVAGAIAAAGAGIWWWWGRRRNQKKGVDEANEPHE